MHSPREPRLRNLIPDDVPAAFALSTEAGWNQTQEDWRLLVKLAPAGCLAIEVAGELAATATLITYERRLAWIGMVLTRTSYRGCGFATRLMKEAISLADRLGIESVKLDATDQGKTLYEKLGFRSEQAVERWGCERVAVTAEIPLPRESFSPSLLEADCVAFGANRSSVLRKLEESHLPAILNNSYAMTRAGRMSAYLGPCVAEAEITARKVISFALAGISGQPCFWDLFPANKEAVALASEYGFAPRRYLTRMVRGKDGRSHDQQIYALGGFELG